MPRPEQVVPAAPEGAPYGSDAAVQRLASSAPTQPAARPVRGGPGGASASPVTPTDELGPPPGPPPLETEELNDGFDEYLFSATDRSDEPLTSGASFGPGANFIPRPAETERQFQLRVAEELQQVPGAGREVSRLIERMRRGE